jgi:hypothetical protein
MIREVFSLIIFFTLYSCELSTKFKQSNQGGLIEQYVSQIHNIKIDNKISYTFVVLNNQNCNSCTEGSIRELSKYLKSIHTDNLTFILSKKETRLINQHFSEIIISDTLYDPTYLPKYGLSKIYPYLFSFKNGKLSKEIRFMGQD